MRGGPCRRPANFTVDGVRLCSRPHGLWFPSVPIEWPPVRSGSSSGRLATPILRVIGRSARSCNLANQGCSKATGQGRPFTGLDAVSDAADLIAMQAGTLAVLTFTIVFYGQWTAGIEVDTRRRTEKIQRIADNSAPAEASSRLKDLDDYLGSALPTRRVNRALLFIATQLRQAVLTTLLLSEGLLWFALLDHSGHWQLARSPEAISISSSASTLLLVVTFGLVFAGVSYIGQREVAVRSLANKAWAVSQRISVDERPALDVVRSVASAPSCWRMVGSVVGPSCAGLLMGTLMGPGIVRTTAVLALVLSIVIPMVVRRCPPS